MKIQFKSCCVFISPVFMGMVTLFLLIDQTGLMGSMLGAMVLHELGHLTMMIMVGCPPQKICLLPFEINMIADQSSATAWEKFCIAVGGIVVNLLVGVVFMETPFGYLNFCLAAFNGLPLYSMDGYQILSVGLGQKRRLVFWISGVVTLAVLLAGGWMLIAQNNPLLLLFCLYLLVLGFMEKRKWSRG